MPSVKANKVEVRDNGPRRGMVVNNNGSRVTKEDKSEVGYGPNKLCRPSIITLYLCRALYNIISIQNLACL